MAYCVLPFVFFVFRFSC